MAIPTSRDDFKEYCLRALGKPVIQINVDDDQVEDRLDEALYVYRQFHYDAVVKTFLNHEITASTMRFAAATTGSFSNGEVLVGSLNHSRSREQSERLDLRGSGSVRRFVRSKCSLEGVLPRTLRELAF